MANVPPPLGDATLLFAGLAFPRDACQTCPCFSWRTCLCWLRQTWFLGTHWTCLCSSHCTCPCLSHWTWLHGARWACPCPCCTCCGVCSWRSASPFYWSSCCWSLTSLALWQLFPWYAGCSAGSPLSSPGSFAKEDTSQVVDPLTCSSSFSQMWCCLCLLQWPCPWPPWGGPCRSSCICSSCPEVCTSSRHLPHP